MDHGRKEEKTAQQTDERPEKSSWTWIVPVALVTAFAALYFLSPDVEHFIDKAYRLLVEGDRNGIESWVRSFGFWGPVAILGLMLLQAVIAVIPSVLIIVVAVLAYGPLLGGLLAWVGLLLAAALGYAIGRALGPVTVDRLIGRRAEHEVARFVERYGFWGVAAFRFAPALSDDAVSLVSGLVKMAPLRFMVASALGILPLVTLVALLGESIDGLKNGLIWISVASVVVFAGYVVYDRRRGNA